MLNMQYTLHGVFRCLRVRSAHGSVARCHGEGVLCSRLKCVQQNLGGCYWRGGGLPLIADSNKEEAHAATFLHGLLSTHGLELLGHVQGK